MTPDEVLRIVDAIVRLGSVLWTWITDEDHAVETASDPFADPFA